MVGVRRRDHQQRDQVVEDRQGEDERAQAWIAARDEPEDAEGEGRVGRHRSSPAAGARAAGVEGKEDQDRDEHPAARGHERQRDPAALAELAHVELPPRLESRDQEEERH